MDRVLYIVTLLGLGAIVFGCSASYTTVPPAGPALAVVFGSATSATGTPVAGATVEIFAHYRTCDSSDPIQERVHTNEEGVYQKQIQSPIHGPHCLRMTATPPASAPGEPQTVSEVMLRFDWQGTDNQYPPLDSVRVDFQF